MTYTDNPVPEWVYLASVPPPVDEEPCGLPEPATGAWRTCCVAVLAALVIAALVAAWKGR